MHADCDETYAEQQYKPDFVLNKKVNTKRTAISTTRGTKGSSQSGDNLQPPSPPKSNHNDTVVVSERAHEGCSPAAKQERNTNSQKKNFNAIEQENQINIWTTEKQANAKK